MFNTTMAETLKRIRDQSGMTQKNFASKFGITQRRWSKLECGEATPDSDELALLHASLEGLKGSVEPAALIRQLTVNAKSHREPPSLYLPPADRISRVRYCSALHEHRDFVTKLTRVIRRRDDFDYCEAHCRLLSLGSADEVLYLLRLLEQGALPGVLAPTSLGRLPHPAVDPRTGEEIGQRPVPCLSFPSDFYFFQISLRATRLYTVDVLRWNHGWTVIEIDGRGHDFRFDDIRSSHLAMPVHRLTPGQIMAQSFLADLRQAA